MLKLRMKKVLSILLAVIFVVSLTAVAVDARGGWGGHGGRGWGGGWGWPYMGYGYGWPYMGYGYGYPYMGYGMMQQPIMQLEQPVIKEVVKEVVCCPPKYVKKYVK